MPPRFECGVLGGDHDVAGRERRPELARERCRGVTDPSPQLSHVGPPERLADFLQLMNSYGIVSLAKSGRIALPRDQKSNKKQLKSA